MKAIRLRNTIMIVTAVWQRHDLAEIVLSYYGKLAARSNGKIQLLAVGSEGAKSRSLCERNGWNYIERPNNIISYKLSAVVQESRNYDYDFLLAIGSDDLLSLSLLRHYDRTYSSDANYMLGLKDLYLYMMSSNKSYHFKGYDSLKTIGAGRCMSRRILKKVNFKPWSEYAINRGLDSRCSSHFNRNGIFEKAIDLKSAKGIGIAVKHHRVAITKEDRIIAVSVESDNMLKKKFPEQYELIKLLK